MTEQEICIECALVDGWELAHKVPARPKVLPLTSATEEKQMWKKNDSIWEEWQMPKYTTSYDAIIPLIQKSFTKSTAHSFFDSLGIECAKETADVDGQYEYQGDGSYYEQWLIFQATPLQLATALLKALGRWKE